MDCVKKLKLSPQPATGARAPAVAIRGLRKSFGHHRVLDGIDLDVAEGTVHALLGPNGSGKTTMVRILSTLRAADAGQVRVAGHDVAAEPALVRAAIGVTGQFSAVDQMLTGELKRLIPGGHIRLRFGGEAAVRAAAGMLPGASPAEDGLTLQVPYDGGVRPLRALLDRLDDDAVPVEAVSVHTPDLDDVFLALTGEVVR
jgi:ABC-2 type transport system ATP-binding protein